MGERDEKREGKLHAQRAREHYQYRNNMKNSRNLIGQEEGKKARRFEPEEGERRGEEGRGEVGPEREMTTGKEHGSGKEERKRRREEKRRSWLRFHQRKAVTTGEVLRECRPPLNAPLLRAWAGQPFKVQLQ